MTQAIQSEPEIYQGQFGEFTITQSDRVGVIIYRCSLAVAAFSFAIGTWLVLGSNFEGLALLTPLYALFCLGLGVSLATIHIYLAPLHRFLQVCWGIGCVASAIVAVQSPEPLALWVYNNPITLFGVGFTFVALTGIFFKEAFCFNRLETKLLTPVIPVLLLGHLVGVLPVESERVLLGLWATLFVVFAIRKLIQAIPPDIGDKSVFDHLKQQHAA